MTAAETAASTAQLRTAAQAAVASLASPYSAAQSALETRAVPVAASAPVAPPNVVSRVVSSVLAWVGLGPLVSNAPSTSNAPLTPVQSPVLWAVLGWVRRQYQQTLAGETPTISTAAVQSGQTVDPAVTDITALSAPVTLNAAAAAADAGSAGFCAGEGGDTADESVVGGGDLHRCADGG